MSYIKTKYEQGKIAQMDWTEQVIMPKNWTNQIIKYPNWQDQVNTLKPYTNSTGFLTGTTYNYIPDKKETKSNLINTNDPSEINSMRDIILGSFNPAMNNGSWFAPLNYVRNVANHVINHYIKPTLAGEHNITGLNFLMDASETLDILSNPIKAIVISAYKGDNIGQALLRSTFGDNTGIHNYDYDTGNKAADIVLEFFSDPLTLIELGTGITASIKGGAKAAATTGTKVATELATDTGKTGVKGLAKGLTKTLGKDVTDDIVTEVTEAGIKQLKIKNFIKNGDLWSDYLKSFRYKDSGKELRKELLNKLIRSNSWDDIAEAYNKNFTQVFAKGIAERTGSNIDDVFKALNKVGKNKYYDTFMKTIDDLVGGAYKASSVGIIASIYNKVEFVDDAITSSIFKAGLSSVGIYPIWRIVNSDAVQEFLHLGTMNKVTRATINRTLVAKDKAVERLGKYLGTSQLIEKDYTVRGIFKDTAKYIGPQEAYDIVAVRLKKDLDLIDDILANRKIINGRRISFADKKEAVLNVLQSFDSYHKITSVEEFIGILEDMQKQVKNLNGSELATTGLENYIKQFKKISEVFSKFDSAELAQKGIYRMKDRIDISTILKSLDDYKVFDDYPTKQVIKALDYQEMLRILGVDDELIFQLKILRTANEELFKRTDIDINKVLKLNKALDVIDPNSLIETLVRNINRVQNGSEFKWIGQDFIDSDVKYLSGVVEGLRHTVGYSAKDNWDKLINTLQKMVDNTEYNLDGLLNQTYYKELFYPLETPAKINSYIRDEVIKQLQRQKDFIPSETAKFKDTNLAHYIEATDVKYHNLIDTIENANKYLQDYTENPNINIYDTNVLKRISDIQSINNVVMTETIKHQYDLPQVQDMIKNVTQEVPLLKFENIGQIENYFSTLKSYAYNNNMHLTINAQYHLDNIKDILIDLNNTLNRINTKGEIGFYANYRHIHTLKNDLIKEYNHIKHIFDNPNVLDTTTDLRRILYSTDPNTFTENVTPKTFADIKGSIKIKLKEEPLSWEAFNFNGKQTKLDYEKYLAQDKYNKELLQKEYQNLKYKKNKTLLTPEEYKYYFGTTETLQYELPDIIDSISTNLDLRLIEKEVITLQSSSNIMFMQLEHFAQQALLNDNAVLKQMRQTLGIREFINQVVNIDHPEVKALFNKAGFYDDDIQVFGIFAAAYLGIDNFNQLMKEVDLLVETIPKQYLPKNTDFKQSILTTLINLKSKRAKSINDDINGALQKIVYGIQGNTNGMDIAQIKNDMDKQIRKYKLEPIIQKELKEAGLDTANRHTSLYDTAAQILAWEKINNKEYSGIMLDIETTGLVEPNKITHGNITEITMMRRNPATKKLEIVYNGKVQLPEEQLLNGYMPAPDVLADMKIKDVDYINYHKVTDHIVTEKNILNDFYATLQGLPIKTRVDTFNGSDFDWVFLDNKLTHYQIPESLTKYDLYRKSKNMIFNNETLRVTQSLTQLLDDLDVHDFYKEISKNTYSVDSTVILKLRNLIQNQASRQLELEKYVRFTGRNPRFIEGVDTNFLDNIAQFMRLDDLNYLKPNAIHLPSEEISEIMSDFLEEDAVEKYLNLRDIINNQQLNMDFFKDTLNPELKKWLADTYESVANQMGDIGTLNKAWRNIPIGDWLYDQSKLETKEFNLRALMDLQNQIADSILNSGLNVSAETIHVLRNKPMTNLTQLATVGLPDHLIIGYRKVPTNRLMQLDLSNIYLTGENAVKLETFYRSATRVRNTIVNDTILPEYSEQMTKMLQQIKNTNISLEATALPINSKDLYYNYSLLEVMYGKLNYMASMGDLGKNTSFQAKQILQQLQKDYPDLYRMLDSGIPSIKVSVNGDRLLYDLPDYMNPRYMDYAKHMARYDVQNKALNKILAYEKTSKYPLGFTKKVKTAGILWNDLWQMYNATYKNGLPTSTTESYRLLGKDFQRVLYAWETHSFLNLTPEDIRKYLIYANRDHIISIKRPTNTYFNNRDLFAQLATKKKALDELGIKWKYDQDTEILTLSVDTSVNKITINKNYNKTIYYLLNGEELEPLTLPEINENDLMYYLKGPQDYAKKMWELRQQLVQMNPELSGHPGLVNVKEQYINVRNNPILPQFDIPRLAKGDEYMPYFNMDMLGELGDVMEATHYFDTDYFETLTNLSNKMINHSHKHLDYGQFIMEGGLKLDSDALSKMSTSEIIDMLKMNPDLTLVYLKDNPKSLGGFELKKVNAYTPNILAKAKELGATIVPYNIYAEAANTINQYTYGNYATAIWHKVISLYKRSWLMNIGTIFRNGVDSTMKTFAEGKDINDTMSAYTKAFDLLNKYDKVAREIKMLDSHGRYRLDLAEEYFKVKTNALLDKDTYHFIYDFMERSGMNTMSSTVDGVFGVLMKPMGDIERISRFAMYLTLEGQGEAYSEIMRRIAQTHFDYGLKSYGQFIAENYIPFVTYVTNNILYLVHLVEENPAFLKNYFNFYQAIWDFDSYNYDELSENTSLQYQILNGNIPLSLFGYKDKQIERIVNTKNGPRKQTVTNTATIRMGSSILDAMQFFINPYYNIKEKLAPPAQMAMDSVVEFGQSALGNSIPFVWESYEDASNNYQKNFGSTSVQSLFRDPKNLLNVIPYLNTFTQRYMHKDINGNLVLGSTTGERTQNDFLGLLSSTFGATNRWGEFENKTYVYPKKTYSGYSKSKVYAKRFYPKKSYVRKPYPSRTMVGREIYYPRTRTYQKSYTPRYYATGNTPYNTYTKFLYRAAYPNRVHNPSTVYRGNLPKLQSIPQYLHSYNGLTRNGKSKLLSWMHMSTDFKVKTTLKRQVRARSLYSKV